MAAGKLFDSYEDDEDEKYEGDDAENPTHLDLMRGILEESKIDIEEEDMDKDYDTYLVLSTGVKLGFDEEGKLIAVVKV